MAADVSRWIAKSLVHAGLARRVLVQLSYAIGVAEPLSIFVETYGTSEKSPQELERIIRKNFDMRPGIYIYICRKHFRKICVLTSGLRRHRPGA
jgi:S-adenosylmethionine synthetase